MYGKVSRFEKGWGFILGDNGRRYYVSGGEIRVPSGILAVGSHVEFHPSVNDRGYAAKNVRPI